MNEQWLNVVGWERFYKISSMGRVYSKRYKKIMASHENHKGYLRINLNYNYKRKGFLVHRLVLIAFVGPPSTTKDQTNHKDGIKTNNNIENLEWASQSENQRHAYSLGLKTVKGEMNPKAKLKIRDVLEIRELIRNKIRQIDIAKLYNITQAQVSQIKLGKSWNYEAMGVKR